MRPTEYLKMAALVALVFVSLSASAGKDWRERASTEDEFSEGDVAAEVAFGREISARILGRYKANNNPALIKYVNLVGLSLVRSTNRPELEYRFMVLETNDVNAYAAPGGYVFVTTGALQLMKDESELAGVLAHEIGHVTEMHVVKELKIKGADDSLTSGLAQLVGGSTESARAAFSQAVDKGLDIIFKDNYKREDEMQADKSAVIVCALGGYDASALARYLDRTRAIKEKVPDPDGTHPTADARISQINEIIAANGMDATNAASNQKRFAAAMKGLKRL
ncbi:MAG: M48 family metalloprotease [Aquabacterium sp.]|uniref:M48 family metalloprotease n=1 Tax=Aquabacterium sp. TaxID=1872578 RepID=UPI0027206073|nr:M48 family metalloprotease [Aquabacterium sp.]MDO9005027.1 M48 family metalloprotease [Aquabacterium sp.]